MLLLKSRRAVRPNTRRARAAPAQHDRGRRSTRAVGVECVDGERQNRVLGCNRDDRPRRERVRQNPHRAHCDQGRLASSPEPRRAQCDQPGPPLRRRRSAYEQRASVGSVFGTWAFHRCAVSPECPIKSASRAQPCHRRDQKAEAPRRSPEAWRRGESTPTPSRRGSRIVKTNKTVHGKTPPAAAETASADEGSSLFHTTTIRTLLSVVISPAGATLVVSASTWARK